MQAQITCFLVDDDKDDQEIFSVALENITSAVTLVTADDGHDALQKLRNDIFFRPDYIFLDLNMPRVNGLQCLEEIKRIEHLKQLPIYIYTTSADITYKQKALALGATSVIIKPSHIDDLTRILEGVFSN